MTVYLLHLERPLGKPQTAEERAQYGLLPRKEKYKPHAQHYIGFSNRPITRLDSHKHKPDVKFLIAAKDQGIRFCLARIWTGGRDKERQLKNQKNAPRFCPVCAGKKPFEAW